MASALTEKQLEAFAAVSHYWEALGEPAPASHVARRIGVTRQRVMEMSGRRCRSLGALVPLTDEFHLADLLVCTG
jgi:hypothetical protein